MPPSRGTPGATAFAVGSDAFVAGGQSVGADVGRGLMRSALPQPTAILTALKRFRSTRGLVLLESIHDVARQAAPPGTDAAATRALRTRKLGRFLLHLAFALQRQEEQKQHAGRRGAAHGDGDGEGGGSAVQPGWRRRRGSGGGDDGAGHGGAAPLTSVLVCNKRVGSPGSYDALLQQYASMRLRLTRAGGEAGGPAAAFVPRVADGGGAAAVAGAAAADVVAARGLARVVTAHMLKGPGVTSRMPAPACTVYLPPDPAAAAAAAAGAGGGAGGAGLPAAPALRAAALPDLALPTWQLLDLVEAGRQLGLVRVWPHGKAGPEVAAAAAVGAGKRESERAAGGDVAPGGAASATAERSAGVPGDGGGTAAAAVPLSQGAARAVWSYAGCEAAGELELVGQLVATGLAAGLAEEVDAMLQRLREGAD
ncbi:hypothetical protein HXX76_000767 [Chlamydomonas incerta]|uniref:Uncharacterized protein n=1 Tax=Chlamydomonas incerta TaxID=51695 RepID=A0A835WEY6_CHLIN|nr:hypothetical protein HXX76_000767 [Chlamydomonas incerta]|eukprot:KAG2446173.1 hypothetical protein HXX76_000767 [Chlamydomonas incerta]